jgi:hypothetical protein
MIDNLVRIADLEQRRPARAGLLGRVPTAATPHRTRGRHRGPISRGRLRGVARVAPQLPLQLHDPSRELLIIRLRLDQREELLTRRLLGPGHRT